MLKCTVTTLPFAKPFIVRGAIEILDTLIGPTSALSIRIQPLETSDRGWDGDLRFRRTNCAGQILVAPTRRLGFASPGFAFELIENLQIEACRFFCGRQRV
jgi:hypothetical protein